MEMKMEKLRVGILGATGMVGQRFVTLLSDHPYFQIEVLAASARSAGKTYEEAVGGRWKMDTPMPETVRNMKVMNVSDVESVAGQVDMVFSAVDMTKDEIRKIEEAYAKTETPVVSNNSAHRWTPDVPMVIPEINLRHFDVIPFQRKRLGTTRGFIAVKPNCSIQAYAPALAAWKEYEPYEAVITTYQAISGVPAKEPVITCQCVRVPVLNGHTAAVFLKMRKHPSKEELIDRLVHFSGYPQEHHLPSAPKQFIQYLEEDNRPQVALDVDYEKGMGVSIGRLREDTVYDWKFIGLAHNTLRGAAGGAVLCAETLVSLGYIVRK